MSRLSETLTSFRARLQAEHAASHAEMFQAYARTWDVLDAQWEALQTRIKTARDSGDDISAAWLFRADRLQVLLRSVEGEIRTFAAAAEARVAAEQSRAIAAGLADAQGLLEAVRPEGVDHIFKATDPGPVLAAVGFSSDGSPLADLFTTFGPEASQEVGLALASGLARGVHPRVIARDIRAAAHVPLVRAQAIARTETMRAYRESTRRVFEENDDVVDGWIWVAGLGRRTCAACWALHGSFHPLGATLDGHVCCRCVMAPHTKSWAELGFAGVDEETSIRIPAGPDLFEKLAADQQEQILGKAAYRAYTAGQVDLTDFVGRKESADWGTMRYTRSLKDALAAVR